MKSTQLVISNQKVRADLPTTATLYPNGADDDNVGKPIVWHPTSGILSIGMFPEVPDVQLSETDTRDNWRNRLIENGEEIKVGKSYVVTRPQVAEQQVTTTTTTIPQAGPLYQPAGSDGNDIRGLYSSIAFYFVSTTNPAGNPCQRLRIYYSGPGRLRLYSSGLMDNTSPHFDFASGEFVSNFLNVSGITEGTYLPYGFPAFEGNITESNPGHGMAAHLQLLLEPRALNQDTEEPVSISTSTTKTVITSSAQPTVTGFFHTHADGSIWMEAATVEGQSGLFTYDLATDTLKALGSDGSIGELVLPTPKLRVRTLPFTSTREYNLYSNQDPGTGDQPSGKVHLKQTTGLQVRFDAPLSEELMSREPELWLFRYANTRKKKPQIATTYEQYRSDYLNCYYDARDKGQITEQQQKQLTDRVLFFIEWVPGFVYVPYSAGNLQSWLEQAEKNVEFMSDRTKSTDNADFHVRRGSWRHPVHKNGSRNYGTSGSFWGGQAPAGVGNDGYTSEFYDDGLRLSLSKEGKAEIPLIIAEWFSYHNEQRNDGIPGTRIRVRSRRHRGNTQIRIKLALAVKAKENEKGRGGYLFSELSDEITLSLNDISIPQPGDDEIFNATGIIRVFSQSHIQ